jgi:hypothetical protein
MATMTPLTPRTDTELQANARLLAGAALAHPLALLLSEHTVGILVCIATNETPATPSERNLLRRALAAIELAEIHASRVAP